MAQEQQAVSFNPDDASGLIDNVDAVVKKIEVDYWKSERSDFRGVYVLATYTPHGGQDFTERYLLGKDTEWTPNATKTGAIPVSAGGRIWNKCEAYKLVQSFVNSGFPKAQVGADLSVLQGSDVHLNRIADGGTYKDKDGKERQRTTMLVTKVNKLPGKGGAATKTPTVNAQPTAGAATAAAPVGDIDAPLADLLEAAVKDPKNKDGIAVTRLPQEVFLRATRAKVAGPTRQAMQQRVVDEGYLVGLVEAGKIAFDGNQVSAAA